jgi:hypothetical protein
MVISDGLDDLAADSPELAEINIARPCLLFARNHQVLLSSVPL